MNIKEKFLTTGIGSLPYSDTRRAVSMMRDTFDIPFWPQLPKKGFQENMYVQYAEGLPGVVINHDDRKIYVDTSKDLSEDLGKLYESYISGDYGNFGISRRFAEGFYVFLEEMKKTHSVYVKGHVTGPISFGLSVVDEKGKSIIYNDTLRDAYVKLLEMKVLWQIERLKEVSDNIILFIDEPYLTSFGSSFINIERKDVISVINALTGKIHSEEALAAIHCCGNTDWSLLAETGTDIINFDAYSYADALSLYPSQIDSFLKKGGYLAWGIVPTSKSVMEETSMSIFNRFSGELERLQSKGIAWEKLVSRSLITPSCGMGTLPENLTDDIMKKIREVSTMAKGGLG